MKYLAFGVALVLAGCGVDPADQVETLEVQSSDFSISLISRGELRAAESTPITPPSGGRVPRTISWLAPNYSWVTKGEVVALFDVSNAELEARRTGLEIDKVDLQVMVKQRELERLLSELGNQMDLVDIEKLMADQFAINDEIAYSRFEVIDAMRNKELLDYRSGHLEGKQVNYSERQGAEVAVLSAQRATQESKFDEQRVLLDNQSVLAPHDGYFVIERNWWGQQVDAGSTVFAGNKFASIPNLDDMEAVLNVLETEAVGLAEGQKAEVVIDAFPDRPLSGEIRSISATASPIERDSPVKYFTVIVALEQADPAWITPEAQVTSEIFINHVDQTIVIPNQALYRDGEKNWVLVQNRGDFERRDVQLGVRGANRSQVLDGLKEGERIALYPPEASG